MQTRLSRFVLFVAIACLATLAGRAGDALAQTNAPDGLFSRIALIGASVSAGFQAGPIPGFSDNPDICRLNRYLDAAIISPHDRARNFGNSFFFMTPYETARQQVEAALQMKPTLVVGVDFLFWFCYGNVPTEEARLQQFDRGLQMLERIKSPLVLGDIPDASSATNSGMLDASQVPTLKTREEANRRLQAWAAKHPQVTVVKLAALRQAVADGRPATIHGLSYSRQDTRNVLQSDHLHLQPDGCALLTVAIFDTLPTNAASQVRWDWKEIERVATASRK